MFKKRVLKKNTSKRVRENIDDIKKDLIEESFIDIKKIDKETDNETHFEVDKKGSPNDAEEQTKSDIYLFKPDLEIDEQYYQLEKNKKIISDSQVRQERDSDGDKLYTGQISHKSKRDELVKPQSTHIKQNFIMDYQQDVCKDFLKNGYCGFGDTCKFLHYREEYKKIEKSEPKDWETAAKRRKKF
ncbi:hypothetical protein C6P40_004491 [Pichia californica]|uniref:Pre-mRNA-splicing factor CWC24 n=1 Tax=Pichia californica TaxID=460514 RepID=A0A9P7BHR2_9ASCO|nr:hypothetical protein C6P42_004984 [[Candida] californica]KAG0689778.1 hypothetical protein C6P40_004491 [[Candida] californica]